MLDSEADDFAFRSLMDDKNKKELPWVKQTKKMQFGSYSDCEARLKELESKGFGSFVLFNVLGDELKEGQPAQYDVNVIKARAIVFDFDDPAKKKDLPIEADLVVSTSPGSGRTHEWFFIDGMSPDEYRKVIAVLSEKYGADPAMKNPSPSSTSSRHAPSEKP